MALLPIGRLKKSEMVWLFKHKCKAHRKDYLGHYGCYLRENPLQQRIGFFDTENSGLDAEWGIMLCYCIKELGKQDILYGVIDKDDLLSKREDRNVVSSCVDDLKKFDRIITYFGTYYDFPFVRTRAVVNKIHFLTYGQLNHTDVYFIIKNKFKLKRNRQENACRTLLGRTLKTHVNPNIWRKALQGDKNELDWVLNHCKRDVKDLERLYNRVVDYSRNQEKSI